MTAAYKRVPRVPDRNYSEALQHRGLGLRFAAALEDDYARYNSDLSLPRVRLGAGVALALYALFFAFDAVLGQRFLQAWSVALFALVVAPVVLAPWLAAVLPALQRHVTLFTAPAIAINGIAIALVAASNTQADNPFPYEVLAAVLLYAFFLGGLLFRVALPLAIGITVFYLAADAVAGLDGVTLADHAFALGTVVLLGGIARWLGERAERRAWLQSQVLKGQALRDALTGLANRHRAYDHVAAALAQARRDGRSVGLLLIDVDHFKKYNDALGHPAGDECLRCIAMVLTGIAHRPLDLEMRLGGEEFAVFLYDCTQAHAEQIAEEIRATVEGMGLPHPGSPLGHVTVSVGVTAGQPGHDDRLDALIQRADPALYQAKQAGRNLVRVTPFPATASAAA